MTSAERASTGGKLPRINSLDALRGLLLVASVTVNGLVSVPDSIDHHPWDGVHAVDVIFPVFVTMTGCGIAFAYRNGVTSWGKLARRVVVLFSLGLLYNALTTNQWDLNTWRVTGVLQLYAVVIGLVSLGHVWFRKWGSWLGITVALTVAYVVMAIFVMHGCPGGELTPDCNPSSFEADAPWNAHVYRQGLRGHDPEGLVSIFGALISMSAGSTLAHAILRGQTWQGRTRGQGTVLLVGLAAILGTTAVLAVLTPTLFGVEPLPIMKRLWTAPFALSVAAFVALALVVLHSVLDNPQNLWRQQATRFVYPLLALGKNSLLVYFGSHILTSWLRLFPNPENSALVRFVGLLGGGSFAAFVIPLTLVVMWTAVAVFLHRRRLYLRA